jgi:glutathione S-transferase
MDLYVDPITTSSRAVLAFCRAANVAVTLRSVALAKGEARSAEYLEINPSGLVPALVDGTFVLTESTAIMRYLARESRSPLYPTELREAAKVDELTAWFGTNFNKDFAYGFVYPQVLPMHRRPTEAANVATIEWAAAQCRRWLDVLDAHHLGPSRTRLVGERTTIADYVGAALLSAGELVACTFADWPNVRRWYEDVMRDEAMRAVNETFLAMAEAARGRSFVPLRKT